MTITVIAEGRYVPRKLTFNVRSPHELKARVEEPGSRPRGFIGGFLLAATIATVVSMGAAVLTVKFSKEEVQTDVLTFAAEASGLPHLAEIYATAPESIRYYDQADLACALAATSTDQLEIDRYRKFVSLTLRLSSGPWLVNSSRANLFYCKGKLDLLLGDKSSAIGDFKQALDLSSSTVDQKAAVETNVQAFLSANSLH